MEALFPDANPLALDLLGRMMQFDQARRITVDAALEHPYLVELHSKAKEPVCDRPFNYDFEKDYPDEMPQRLLQQLMYRDMLAIREEQKRKGLDTVGKTRGK
jgi:serine/threonine protein kinase